MHCFRSWWMELERRFHSSTPYIVQRLQEEEQPPRTVSSRCVAVGLPFADESRPWRWRLHCSSFASRHHFEYDALESLFVLGGLA